ncbi:hypothetical protein CK203_087625 [Vitis vinifera]|uniref:Uncharacterized protein n=1 Tax=Vitis vinifera TaxID=29760 RepID=A0A438C748_VITVI|nr:hypothetical protein CK203_087625 [Vitis vinifera]
MVRILSRATSGDSFLLPSSAEAMSHPGCAIQDIQGLLFRATSPDYGRSPPLCGKHMGYPTEPHLERCRHCREHFTLDKWTQLASYSTPVAAPPRPTSPVPPQVEQPQ